MGCCPVCAVKISDAEAFKRHVQSHENEEELEDVELGERRTEKWKSSINRGGKCLLCNEEVTDLIEHSRRFHPSKKSKCPFCDDYMADMSLLPRHLDIKHPFETGVLPGRGSDGPEPQMSGTDLKEELRKYGQDTSETFPYLLYCSQYSSPNQCYDYVAYAISEGLLDEAECKEEPIAEYANCNRINKEQPISFQILRSQCDHGHGAPKSLYKGNVEAYKESYLWPNISAQKPLCYFAM